MFVLVIAAAVLVVSAALLGMRLFSRRDEPPQPCAGRMAPEPLFSGMSYSQAFDSNYGLIWQTQVPALELIRRAGSRGLPVQTLKPWFRHALRCYPDLFEGHTFEEWLDFLCRSQVADCGGGDHLQLTARGCELLDHCRMAG